MLGEITVTAITVGGVYRLADYTSATTELTNGPFGLRLLT
jgi:hypothetical protein